jgi:hypothetical protein
VIFSALFFGEMVALPTRCTRAHTLSLLRHDATITAHSHS